MVKVEHKQIYWKKAKSFINKGQSDGKFKEISVIILHNKWMSADFTGKKKVIVVVC